MFQLKKIHFEMLWKGLSFLKVRTIFCPKKIHTEADTISCVFYVLTRQWYTLGGGGGVPKNIILRSLYFEDFFFSSGGINMTTQPFFSK
jgi:hypothetical protein